uniref:Protein kinase domain-containing protein n=1 Tax=Mesocestoides corti TaxID=53468 RepID=A0A5K3ER24_MESCO
MVHPFCICMNVGLSFTSVKLEPPLFFGVLECPSL